MNLPKKGASIVFLTSIFLFMSISPTTVIAAKSEKTGKVEKKIEDSMSSKVRMPNAAFDINKMADMSDFDPLNPKIPKGDTIKIAVVGPHSGPSTFSGQMAWICATWVAHDINKRGGILVDGKRKMIEMIKADNMSKPDQCKKVSERMVLIEKAPILLGTSGSNMQKIINETANKYKVIAVNIGSLADELMDASAFSRYAFMSSSSTEQIGRGLAYHFGQIRKKEKKFYILCQDYSFGRGLADGFKKGLKEYYPGGQIVGEDYHKLFLTDFAPYLTKVKSSGAEVIYTSDFAPDAGNLLKQAREMGVKLPFADVFMDDVAMLHEVGVEGSKGMVHIDNFDMPMPFKNPAFKKFYKAWNDQWRNKWTEAPYNSRFYEHGTGTVGSWTQQIYWLISIIERAKSTDPEKIIRVWEGDTYRFVNGKVIKMRACDHKAIQDFTINEYVSPEQQKRSFGIPPYYWFKGTSFTGPQWLIPAGKVLPKMDQNLDRCAGKNAWGE